MRKQGLVIIIFSIIVIYSYNSRNDENAKMNNKITTITHQSDSLRIVINDLEQSRMYCNIQLDEQNKKIENLYMLIIKLNRVSQDKRCKICKEELPQIFAIKDKTLFGKSIN